MNFIWNKKAQTVFGDQARNYYDPYKVYQEPSQWTMERNKNTPSYTPGKRTGFYGPTLKDPRFDPVHQKNLERVRKSFNENRMSVPAQFDQRPTIHQGKNERQSLPRSILKSLMGKTKTRSE